MIRQIRSLLYDQGYTIEGARQRFSDGTGQVDTTEHNQLIQQMISELEEHLDALRQEVKEAPEQEVAAQTSPQYRELRDSLNALKLELRAAETHDRSSRRLALPIDKSGYGILFGVFFMSLLPDSGVAAFMIGAVAVSSLIYTIEALSGASRSR